MYYKFEGKNYENFQDIRKIILDFDKKIEILEIQNKKIPSVLDLTNERNKTKQNKKQFDQKIKEKKRLSKKITELENRRAVASSIDASSDIKRL